MQSPVTQYLGGCQLYLITEICSPTTLLLTTHMVLNQVLVFHRSSPTTLSYQLSSDKPSADSEKSRHTKPRHNVQT